MSRIRASFCVAVIAAMLITAAMPGMLVAAAPLSATVPIEFVSGVVGGLGGAVLAVMLISEINPTLEPRWARIGVVIGSVAVLGGAGAAIGVLAASKALHVQGDVSACALGGFIGGFASTWVEPLLYALGIPEGITEFVGMLMLPIAPALGATLGFNRRYQAESLPTT
ncbi:hypothetical protein JW848_01765 [Candidatus Bipolaricaulota bacterium]|nr:hypothetical protein [Candidatus Bipolaricaulota bacterium]